MISVTALSLAPVKGMRVSEPEAVALEPSGPAGDRAFFVVDADDHGLLLTTRNTRLVQVEPDWDPAAGVLGLRFPDGTRVSEPVDPGAPAVTHGYDGREVRGRLVDGTLADALSEHLGRKVLLLARDEGVRGADDFPVSLMSIASLHALAGALGGSVPDARRFRMTITVDGVDAWEEEGWSELAIGDAVLHVEAPVPRCAVTTRDPESGSRDAPVLRALAELRGKRHVEFGVWCTVGRPGTVRRGDEVRPA